MHPALAVVAEAIEHGPIPGAAGVVGRVGRLEFAANGRQDATGGPRVTPATLFDLASLTKVLFTAVLVARDVAVGRLDPDAPLREHLPEAAGPVAQATICQLLTHTSGLAPLSELRYWSLPRAEALRRAARVPLAGTPGDIVYSDQGYIILGAMLERLHGERLDLLAERLYSPLGLDLRFMPPLKTKVEDLARCARTEVPPEGGAALQGVVHDENAQALDGVAGHAGLFGSAAGVAKFLEALLDGAVLNSAGLEFLTRQQAASVIDGRAERRAAGWLLASPGWFGGSAAPETTLGHTGFTGTAAWFDPPSGRIAVLLTNRVCPSRNTPSGIVELREQFGTAAFSPRPGEA